MARAEEIAFDPFEAEIQCKGCGHTIFLWMQPLHLENRTLCPSCTRPLTAQIHRAISAQIEKLIPGKDSLNRARSA